MPSQASYRRDTPVRISFHAADPARGREILEHLVEERLAAGGTLVRAESVHWLGGEMRREERRVASAYTTLGKVPLIRGRLEALYGEDAPVLSQFVMTDERRSVMGWIERNTREG